MQKFSTLLYELPPSRWYDTSDITPTNRIQCPFDRKKVFIGAFVTASAKRL